MKIKTILLAFALVLTVFTLQAQPERHFDLAEQGEGIEMLSVGKIVLANWSYDDFWYAGKIEKTSHDKYFGFLGEFSGGQKKSPESVKKVTFRLWNQISYMSYC
jgi:hypothetical protein